MWSLPHITIQDIDDKSKTDGTAKLTCCVQVTWILVQTITGLAIGLAISPLEINTLGHVVCALLMYALGGTSLDGLKNQLHCEEIGLRGCVHSCTYLVKSAQNIDVNDPSFATLASKQSYLACHTLLKELRRSTRTRPFRSMQRTLWRRQKWLHRHLIPHMP